MQVSSRPPAAHAAGPRDPAMFGAWLPSLRGLSVEHSWPCSHGTTGIADADLHHLHVADRATNQICSDNPCGEVVTPTWTSSGSRSSLATLLKWHESDPVTDAERARDDVIQAFQGNRNPSVDLPELAARVGSAGLGA